MKRKSNRKTKMSDKPRSEIRKVTPEWARQIIDKHLKELESGAYRQRPISDRIVKAYASDMKAGNWSLTGQGISFDTDGHLMDGQHRVAAVVAAGVEVDMLIMWGLPAEHDGRVKTINLFDIGKKRTVGGQLKIEGMEYYNEVGAAARCLIILSRGLTNIKGVVYTLPQQVAVAEAFQHNIYKLIHILRKDGAPTKNSASYILAPLALLHCCMPDEAELFATEFNEGTGLSKTSPVLHFKRHLENSPARNRGGDYQIHEMGVTISALYSYVNEKRVEASIRGRQEHTEWLLKLARNALKKVRDVAGIELTMEELKAKE